VAIRFVKTSFKKITFILLLAHLPFGFLFKKLLLFLFFSPTEQYAVASSANGQYYGTQISINLWKPMTETAKDFSLTQLWISAGSYDNNDLNTIEAGWQVRHFK
jgi:hypothetical protein